MKPMVNQSKRIAAQRSVPFENQVQLVFFDIHKPNTAIYIIPQPSAMSEQDRRAKVEQEVQKHIGLVRSCMKSVHGVTSSNEDDIYQAGLIALWQAGRRPHRRNSRGSAAGHSHRWRRPPCPCGR